MSYISNGCNDCSSVDFGATGTMNSGNSTNFLNPPQNTMFENTQQNQFMYQQPQQPQVQQHQVQQPVLQPVLQQQQPQVQQKFQQAPKPVQQQQYNNKNTNNNNGNNGIQHILGSYLLDNAFVLIVAFIVASAWHTTIKYYIDQAIKFNGGTPTYYIVYAVVATILSIFLTTMKS
jgi:hypothetical protein